jgi:hypothetical protein
MDVQNNNYDLFGANRHLMPFENQSQNLYCNHVMFLHKWVLNFSRILGIQSLQNLDVWINFYGFYKICTEIAI